MALHVALNHRTEYVYDRLTGLGPQVVRLRPAAHSRTPILSYSLKITPKEHFINWQQDPFGNYLARLVFTEPTREFKVEVDLVADMATINPFDFFVDEYAGDWPFTYDDALKEELAPYLKASEPGPLLKTYLSKLHFDVKTSLDFIWALNGQLQHDVKYLIRLEPGVQTPEETLTKKSGSCRDSAWLLVNILRNFGLAARFVSGYLIQLKADVKSLDGPSGTEQDFTDLHAWAEVYLPGAGWIGLDPTSGLFAGEGHIPLAATPSPQSAAPITGMHEEAEVEFSHHMHVTRILESPRVTLPYTEEQWAAIATAGHEVDRRLKEGDVRLSMGGEPTFVSIDDVDGAEWNTDAVGPYKRRYAENLIKRLRDRFAPGGLLHFGQGKWYPGEQLPRWSFSVYWRKDGQPLWENDALIDNEVAVKPATDVQAERFAAVLAEQLGLPADAPIPAYEDPAHFMLIEQKLPLNLDAADNKLEDPQERARVIRVFERGLDKPAGYVMPVQVWHSQELGRRWVTERWALRRQKLFLLPGDSPLGFRLPLGSLSYITASNFPKCLAHRPVPGAPRHADPRQAAPRTAGVGDAAAAGHGAAAPQRGGRLGADGNCYRAARRAFVRVHAAALRRGGLRRARRLCRRGGENHRAAHSYRRLSAAERLALQRHQGDAGPRRDRGQHPACLRLGRGGEHHRNALRRGAAYAARHREIHDRRPPQRHGRRQSHRAGRADARRQSVPAPAGLAAKPDRLLAEPPVDVLPVLGHVHRPDQPSAAHRRSARTTRSTRWRSRSARSPIRAMAGYPRGKWTASSATS